MVEAIYEAYNDFIKSGNSAKLLPDGKYEISGFISNGIEIKMFLTKNGKIATAYPVLK